MNDKAEKITQVTDAKLLQAIKRSAFLKQEKERAIAWYKQHGHKIEGWFEEAQKVAKA